MGDYFSDPRHLEDYDRAVLRELDQREWEADDTRILPKPARRYRATKDEWINFHEWRTEQPCWVCGGRSESTHHIYPRGQGGDDFLENFAPLCGSGTTGCHGLIEARDPSARAALGAALTPENCAYLVRKLGSQDAAAAWIGRHYPERVAA